MGQVYGRMSIPGAVSIYSTTRWSSGDHFARCPSKAKPGFHDASGNKSAQASSDGQRRRLSLPVDHSDGQQQPAVRLTRNGARQLAIQQAIQQAASIRRSARLAGARPGALRNTNRSGKASNGSNAATLPTTLRRSARIAGFRYIGHRLAADLGASSSAARLRRVDLTTTPNAPTSSAPSLELRRSARLVRAH